MYSNIVWVPIEAPKMIRPMNIGVDGKLKVYVAKTVAKDYSLKLCFNQRKPFQ